MKRPAAVDWTTESAEVVKKPAGWKDWSSKRSPKVVVEAGKDADGNELPVNDQSGYSRQQKWVFEEIKKELPHDFSNSMTRPSLTRT